MTASHDPAGLRWSSMRLLALVMAAGAATYFSTERGQHAMRPSAYASSPSASIPLIDTIAPKQVATATFAMG